MYQAYYRVSLLSITLLLCSWSASATWREDFAQQAIAKRPPLEVRYTDADREAFEILAQDYRLRGELQKPNRLLDWESGALWLSLWVEDDQGKRFSSDKAKTKSRINLYRRGPYFCEVHWMDLRLADNEGKLAPLFGDVALYCYPDKILMSVTWHAKEAFEARTAGIEGLVQASTTAQAFPANSQQHFAWPLFGEAPPLPESALKSRQAVNPLHYDAVRGCYTIASLGKGAFQGRFYTTPHLYDTVAFSVQNDATPRTIYICHENAGGDKGCVEGAVLLDESGHPLPITVQISKNFAGEKEEKFYNPKDTSFSESYFPLLLEPEERCALSALHLYQDWGAHPVKQFSSLGAWMDYFHSSTGVTETTCYVPFKFGGLSGVDIADFRAMSQEAFWPGQPQHDNVAGHSFLWYRAKRNWQYLCYRGTSYRSTGANWMDIGFEYLSTDGAIKATVDSFELPQADELRQFVHVRYEVIKPLTIKDARKNFRALSAASWVQKLRYTHFIASDMEAIPLDFTKNRYALAGQPLPKEGGFLAVYGDAKGGNGFVLRDWEASLGGLAPAPAATVYCEKKGDTRLLLTVDADTLSLKPGDYLDFNAILMPFGAKENADAVQRESRCYAANAPKILSVTTGKARCDFPTTVQAENDVAQFTVSGGRDLIPIIVTGLSDYKRPCLQAQTEKGWRVVQHHHVWEDDGLQVACEADGRFRTIFLIHSNEAPQTLRVSLQAEKKRPLPIALLTPEKESTIGIKLPDQDKPIPFDFPARLIDSQGEEIALEPAMRGDWKKDPAGDLFFKWKLKGFDLGGRITPRNDHLDLMLWTQNNLNEVITLSVESILRAGAPQEGDSYWVYSDKSWIPLDKLDAAKQADLIAWQSNESGRLFALRWNAPEGKEVRETDTLFSRLRMISAPKKRKVIRGKLYCIQAKLKDLSQRIERECYASFEQE